MEKVVRKFDSFAAAAQADRAYYRSLTGQQRLDILLEMIARHQEGQDGAKKGFERVFRIIKLGER